MPQFTYIQLGLVDECGLVDNAVMNDRFQLLLEKAARFHDRHETGRRETFNLIYAPGCENVVADVA